MTIVVAGALANKVGSGGEAWVRLSWIRGFQQLGHEVWFVEELSVAEPRAVAYFTQVVRDFDLADRAALLVDGRSVVGAERRQIERVADRACLVNISGHLRDAALLAGFDRRIFVDIDPGYTQFWHADGLATGLDDHDHHVTIGANIGRPGCPIPTLGLDWHHVHQPVVLADWPVTRAPAPDRFTTVGNLRGPYGRVEIGGRRFGLKIHEQRKVLDLPRRVPAADFELAMAIDDADRADAEQLLDAGWRLVDPARCHDPAGFGAYVRASGAEFSVAQGIYVETSSGWFSDRSVRYLASGRPVVVQDTGFGDHLPVGEGVLCFADVEQAAAAVERVLAEPERHARAARRVAEEHFDARRVLAALCDRFGIDARG